MIKKKKIKAVGLEPRQRIIVAMSGGVDSSVTAALLKKQGYFVIGVFMKFWHDSPELRSEGGKEGRSAENRCCSVESEKMARLVAKKIGMPFYVVNAENEFKKKVVDYFLKEYKKGNTPNPCAVCNKEIKFGFLIEKALKMGADYIATGHYTRILRAKSNFLSSQPASPFGLAVPIRLEKIYLTRLLKARDKNKDQSYFLWQLNQKQLSRVLFPVGNYTKPEVRALAKKFNLPTAETKESQEVCFVMNSTNEFLKKYLKTKPGNIIDKNRKILGEHQGLHFYTIGQRKGIGLSGGPYFVVAKDFKKNNLIISKNQKDLESKELIAKNVNWVAAQKLPISAEVKIRYKSNFAKAKILGFGKNKVRVIFEKSQKAISPGQSAVFYKSDELLGGGIIGDR